MANLAQQNILLGVTGGIAAYKACDMVRKLTALGANVRVVLSASAREFVTPLSLQAVSGNPVSEHLLDPAAEAGMGHIELAKWADHILIAPATAHVMAKLAHGMADDLLTTLVLASTAPLSIAPAMNQQMWAATATQENLNRLQQRGVNILGPAAGEQACGDVGYGRMLEPVEIAQQLAEQAQASSQRKFSPSTHTTAALPLEGQRLLITAGPTQEAIDPVRYISNHSSGKMGYALAVQAVQLGAQVTLVSGPVALPEPLGVNTIKVISALDMHAAVMAHVADCDVFIGCAAVADYRLADVATQKIKKTQQVEMQLTLVKNPDILADVAALDSPPFTVGFAAETQDVEHYAKDKLRRKKLNMIAANDVSDSNIGFNQAQNALTVYTHDEKIALPQQDKLAIAEQLLTIIARYVSTN
jgi:phosphopantothenoylcysteine decarboxylase/phosphopantothenate--cysteine ligase